MTAPDIGCSCDRFGDVDCTSCRLCEDLCPSGLDLARVVLTSRCIRGPVTSHQDLFTNLATLEAQGAEGPLGEWHATRPGVRTGTDVVFFPGTAALLDVYFRREAEYAAGFRALGGRLVPRLVEALRRSSHGTVVCASAEDAHALRDLHGVEAVHISEFLRGRDIDLPGAGTGTGTRHRVAFFDPCRLGR